MAPRIINLEQWSAHLLARLHRQAGQSGDEELTRLHEELAGYPGVALSMDTDELAGSEIVLPLHLRASDGSTLSFLSTVSTFGSAMDLTAAELSVEAFYPANARTAAHLLGEIS